MRVSNWLGAVPTLAGNRTHIRTLWSFTHKVRQMYLCMYGMLGAVTGGVKWALHSKRELFWQCLDLLGTLLGFLTNIAGIT
jgi:hypothetical protein